MQFNKYNFECRIMNISKNKKKTFIRFKCIKNIVNDFIFLSIDQNMFIRYVGDNQFYG